MRKASLTLAAVGCALLIAAPRAGFALSAGCEQINALYGAGGVNLNDGTTPLDLLSGGAEFVAGETIRVEFTVAAIAMPSTVTAAFSGAGSASASAPIAMAGGSTASVTVVAPVSGFMEFTVSYAIMGSPENLDFQAVCSAGEAARDGQTRAVARAAIMQSVGLALGRTRAIVGRGVQSPTAAPSVGAQSLSAGRGTSGQAGETPIGVWGDFAWTGLEDDSAIVDSNTNAFTIGGGVDTQTDAGIVFGASLSIGRAFSEASNNALTTRETSVNVSPYFAYQIDDRFSVQGVVGYGYGAGDSDRNGVTGDYDAHRYYVAVEGALFETWGDASLYAGVGVLYGRSHRLAFTESDETRVGSARIDVGSASVILQPSYLFTLDDRDGVFVEPFATLEYGYDFYITKIPGATNDRDAFRIGGGANLYGGDAVSGAVEATRMLGREDQDETNVRATLRVDF